MNVRTEANGMATADYNSPRHANPAAPADSDPFGWQPLKRRLLADKVTRLAITFLDRYEDVHLKDFEVDEIDDQRQMRIGDKTVINFGSDSFLGLDRDERVQKAIAEALPDWGTHNGASRAFWGVSLCSQVEERLAKWLGVPDTLLYTSVTLANIGLLPALAGKGDLLVVDRQSHDSIQQGAKLAAAGGATLRELFPCDAGALREILKRESYKGLVVAVDGIYSMSGRVAPLRELEAVTREFGGLLYVDDAHGTGVVGPRGRGAAITALGSLERILMVGSLSKAYSCMGAFVTCDRELKRILKIKSSTFIFGGPIPPPYLCGILAACDLIDSEEGDELLADLHAKIDGLMAGLTKLGYRAYGDSGAIVSVLIGDIEKTFKVGKWLFDRGYYVQSATYPAVGINEGLLRIQVNANHAVADLEELLAAFAELREAFSLPMTHQQNGS
jgi:7-keto-8-aminopelargonate synthetase-like enzyme